jgi:hypothetical protein
MDNLDSNPGGYFSNLDAKLDGYFMYYFYYDRGGYFFL